MRVQLEDSGLALELDGPPLGRGGEAAIFAVPELPNRAAKIYHRPTPEHADKLAAMLAAPPLDPGASFGHVSIAWPVKRLLSTTDAARVVGYLMPRLHHVRLVQEFYNPKARALTCPLFHYGYLLRTARNLAISVRALHECGYVIGDVSAANLLVSTQALVTLVDTDSFQVPAATRIYRCRVGTPEYTPPELQAARFPEVDRGPEHDSFGLAVLIFQLLMQGTHPFAGLFTGNGEPPAIPRRILAGHWPYAQRQLVPFQPSPHSPPWHVLPPAVQDLMRRCFEEGHERPSVRPTPQEWQRTLQESEEALATCKVNTQHVYHRSLDRCPWCALAVQQGRDPFPSVQAVQETASSNSATPKTALAGQSPEPPPAKRQESQDQLATPLPLPKPPREKRPARFAVQESFWTGNRLFGLIALAGSGVVMFAAVLLWSWAASATSKRIEPMTFPTWFPEQSAFAGLAFAGELPAELLARFDGHTDAVRCAQFSANGGHILSGSSDQTVRLWEVESGRSVTTLTGHTDKVASVAISPDGRFALSGSHDGTARYWELNSGKELQSFRRHENWVNCVAFPFSGPGAFSGGNDRAIRKWSPTDGVEWQRFDGHAGSVECLALSRDGQWLAASGGDDYKVHIWNVPQVRLAANVDGHQREVTCLSFSPDSRRLLTGSLDGTARLWELLPRVRQVLRFQGHTDGVLGVAISPDGRQAATAGRDRTVRVWDILTGREVHRFAGPQGAIYSVAFAPDGASVLSACEDGSIYLWRLLEPDKSGPDSPLDDETPVGVDESELLKGTWTIKHNERDGKAAPPLFYRNLRLDIEADRITARTSDGTSVRQARYRIDTLSRPMTIDIEIADGAGSPVVERGIFRLQGDRLRILGNYTGGERPWAFNGPPAGLERLVLRRIKP